MLGLFASETMAQSTLIGSVTSDTAGKRPLIGVEVSIPSIQKSARTDSAGSFRIDGLALGAYTVVVRAVGHQPAMKSVTIDAPDGNLRSFVLPAFAPTLDTVVATAPTSAYISPALRGFEQRRKAGFGYFVGEEVLRKSELQPLAELTRRFPGTQLVRNRNETYLSSTRKTTAKNGKCFATVYLDGVLVYDLNTSTHFPVANAAHPTDSTVTPPNLDEYIANELAGIEYYPGEASAPVGFRHSGCGLLLLWTREK